MAAKRNKPLLELKIEGPRVHAGRISVPELVHIWIRPKAPCIVRRKPCLKRGTLRRGPVADDVKDECTLELVGISKGSAVLSFDLAKPQLSMAPTMAVDVVWEGGAIQDLNADSDREYDPGVLDSLNGLGEVFDRGGVEKSKWVVPRRTGTKKHISAAYNKCVRDHVIKRVKIPECEPLDYRGHTGNGGL